MNWKNKQCLVCGEIFIPTSGRQKYCNKHQFQVKKEKTKQWISNKIHELKNSEKRFCECGCGTHLIQTYTGNYKRRFINGHNNKGKRFSKIHRENMSKSMNRGKTKLIILIRTELKYKDWRKKVFQRDNYICQISNIKSSGKLIAHHIKSLALILKENNIKTIQNAYKCSEIWDINNGLTLLSNIHELFHNKYGKTNFTKKQLMEFKNGFFDRNKTD